MTNLEDVLRRLDARDVAGGASEAAIRRAESELGVVFPRDYHEFLSTYGAAIGPGFSVAGIAPLLGPDRPPLWDNVVDATLRLRRASKGELSASYVFVADDGGDFKFFIEVAGSTRAATSRVVAIGPGTNSIVVAESFAEFVTRLSTDAIVLFRRA